MNISAVINRLESWAPLAYQESYDNAGLICGNPEAACTGVLCSLDCTEEVVQEAVRKGCNLVVAHHPIVFAGLKKITPHSYVGRAITAAILNGVNIYAIHTNLDNIEGGVSFKMAEKLGLEPSTVKVLEPKNSQLYMLYTYVPTPQAKLVYEALFAAGAGHIGRYAECAFALEGTGSFRPLEGTNPTIGNAGGPREY
ncbi:MAG TPA: Nif3-like dinuclear metal center hexameric protein, partial [Phnomibacter sp.]|nr:Nif3-like dinuclear metal center hexameric protein [Phnomibacter sp.]